MTSGLFTVAPILNPIQVLHCSFDSQDLKVMSVFSMCGAI